MKDLLRAVVITLVSLGVAAGAAFFAGSGSVEVGGVAAPVWVAALAFVVNWLAFIPAALWRTERFYDGAGSVTFIASMALAVGSVVAAGVPLDVTRLVPALLVVVWAGRLGLFLVRRVHRAGKDGRFDEMKQVPARFFVAWTLQGLWVFLTSLAAVVLITTKTPAPFPSVAALVGYGVWVLGFGVEVVADRQKATFSSDAKNRGRFIDVGLWAWSRHPNYFGEIVLWLGVFLSGAQAYQGGQWVAVLSPLFVALLLTKVSGLPLLEQRADEKWGTDAAYQAYKAKTPVLIPRPPSR